MKKLTLTLLVLLCSFSVIWADSTIVEHSTLVEDTWIRSNTADSNFGSAVSGFIYDGGGIFYKYLIRFDDIADSVGDNATIDSAKLFLFISNDVSTDKGVLFYGLWNNNWVENDTGSYEGGATWNDWSSPDSEWTTAGVNCLFILLS